MLSADAVSLAVRNAGEPFLVCSSDYLSVQVGQMVWLDDEFSSVVQVWRGLPSAEHQPVFEGARGPGTGRCTERSPLHDSLLCASLEVMTMGDVVRRIAL
ncbi:MAG: hypothetical protein ACRDHX_13755 [Chloroflexota bacterium]